MSKRHLARARAVEQLSIWALSASTCGLSSYFTLCFMRHLWPNESLLVVGTFGGAWELAKLRFGPKALTALRCAEWQNLAGHLALLALTACLMLGSIVASIGHIAYSHDHANSKAHAQHAADTLREAQASDAYRSAQREMTSLDAEIDALSASMADDIAHHFRSRAMATAHSIAPLRDRRARAAAEAARIQGAPGQGAAPFDLFANMATALPGNPDAVAARIKMAAHVFLAVMLELVGIAAWSSGGTRALAHADIETASVPGTETNGSGPRPGLRPAPVRTAQRVRTRMHIPPRPVYKPSDSCTVPGTMEHQSMEVHRARLLPAPCTSVLQTPAAALRLNHAPCTAEKYTRALALIASHALVPNHRWLRRHLRVGQQTAQLFLQQLCFDGYIERVGRKYVLSEVSIGRTEQAA